MAGHCEDPNTERETRNQHKVQLHVKPTTSEKNISTYGLLTMGKECVNNSKDTLYDYCVSLTYSTNVLLVGESLEIERQRCTTMFFVETKTTAHIQLVVVKAF